ncbi:hypothetical protein GF312_19895 [Candidatus Poribacteria bacterium]|nr:hypothetical protein [Candidatus Poribacteria bacterium]
MKKYIVLILTFILIPLYLTNSGYTWELGENRLLNSNFEDDEVGQEAKEWALEKGG